jgi:peptide methionine sulfoxide reductase msrA/msrB
MKKIKKMDKENKILLGIISALVFFLILFISGKNNEKITTEKNEDNIKVSLESYDRAYFAGGCFWCIEAPFQETEGVLEAISGYIGGAKEKASYESVITGKTKHRESVEVIYDENKVSYEKLLEIFFTQIDPTDDGGQFADRGFQYTSGIYFRNKEEKRLAEEFIFDLEKTKKFDKKITVNVLPFEEFFKAEEYHQDFYKKSADYYKKYKKGSGRTGYIEENWAKELALTEIKKKSELVKKTNTSTAYFSTKDFWINFKKPAEGDLKKQLTELQFKVTQEDATEKPFDNKYWDNKEEGIYVDVVSGEPLFSSRDKYKSGTGWPSFAKTLDGVSLVEKEENNLFYSRTEIKSKIAMSHLGHIFPDGPKDRGGLRYCINSASLRFVPVEEMKSSGYIDYLEVFK